MVEIIKAEWKGYLVPESDSDNTKLPSPESLRNKILIKVKHVDAEKAERKSKRESKSPAGSSSSASEEEDAPAELKDKKKKSSVVPSLSALGVYTRAYHFKSLSAPEATLPNHVFSLNEKRLMQTHSSLGPTVFSHNRNYLMRAFPTGMRVRSDNLDPAPFWRKGVQMVALNWQRWDEGMMLNEGMFTGSKGYVLKPAGYRSTNHNAPVQQITAETQADGIMHKTLSLSIEALAAQDIPLPLGDTKPEGFHPYIKCELHVEKLAERLDEPIEGGGKSEEGEFKWKSKTMKSTEVDFGGEKVEFMDIPGVVEELSFVRYVPFSCHCFHLMLLSPESLCVNPCMYPSLCTWLIHGRTGSRFKTTRSAKMIWLLGLVLDLTVSRVVYDLFVCLMRRAWRAEACFW